jgi:hypothetical protein
VDSNLQSRVSVLLPLGKAVTSWRVSAKQDAIAGCGRIHPWQRMPAGALCAEELLRYAQMNYNSSAPDRDLYVGSDETWMPPPNGGEPCHRCTRATFTKKLRQILGSRAEWDQPPPWQTPAAVGIRSNPEAGTFQLCGPSPEALTDQWYVVFS